MQVDFKSWSKLKLGLKKDFFSLIIMATEVVLTHAVDPSFLAMQQAQMLKASLSTPSSAPLSAPLYTAVEVRKWPGLLVLNDHSALLSLNICLL
jgi:hypothetical protein